MPCYVYVKLGKLSVLILTKCDQYQIISSICFAMFISGVLVVHSNCHIVPPSILFTVLCHTCVLVIIPTLIGVPYVFFHSDVLHVHMQKKSKQMQILAIPSYQQIVM